MKFKKNNATKTAEKFIFLGNQAQIQQWPWIAGKHSSPPHTQLVLRCLYLMLILAPEIYHYDKDYDTWYPVCAATLISQEELVRNSILIQNSSDG
jgi:hypothetical protein